MPTSPVPVLVDPRAQRRAAVRQRLVSLAVGFGVATASAIPYALTLRR
jgi:hypothetical protein